MGDVVNTGQRARGDVAGRPPTQWGTAAKSETSSGQAVGRGLGLLALVLNPVVAVTSVLLAIGARGVSRRVRAWLAAGGAAAFAVAVVAGGGRGYVRPYRELVEAAVPSARHPSGGIGAVAAERWPQWLADQLAVGLTAGVLVCGLWLLWRTRYHAAWRDVERVVPPKKVQGRLQEMARHEERKPARSVDELTLRLGVDVHTGAPCTIPGRALRQHAFVAGATGYGKTRSIEQLAYELVVSPHARALQIPFLFADMKGDPELVDALRGAAHEAGRRFRLVTVTGQGDSYNPIKFGTPEQVRSRIVECLDQVAGGGFSEPHHREAAEEFLLYCVRALDDLVAQPQVVARFADGMRPWRRDLVDLARLMTIKALQDRQPQLTDQVRADIAQYLEYLASEARELRKSIPGLATRVRNLISGDAGRVLTERADGIDLYDSIKGGDVVLLSLAAATDARAARQIGSLFLTDLGSVGDRLLAERWGSGGGLFVAGVDEFSALGGSTMASLFQRIRGAGGGLMLCTQDMADLTEVSPAFAAAVMTNSNVLILHRQKAAAETIAELLGTRQTWEETVQVQEDIGLLGSTSVGSGVGSLRQVDKFKVHPNTLRELPTGQAVVAVGSPADTIQTVQMLLAPRYTAPTAVEDAPVQLTKQLPPVAEPRAEAEDEPRAAATAEEPEPEPADEPAGHEEGDATGGPRPVKGSDMWLPTRPGGAEQ